MRTTRRQAIALSIVAAAFAIGLPSFGQEREEGAPPVPAVKRPWGPEQATGAPDTLEEGDRPTAWASRETDAGPEWLRLDYEKEASIAEVRVRETCNPGATCKVTAFLKDGTEAVLWEGVEPPLQAPGDFVVVIGKDKEVVSKSVKVYLDTARVPGWNEIDAVELVGKDGTRQWASKATASSTFAEQAMPVIFPGHVLPPDPFNELGEVPVKVHLEDKGTLEGVFVRSAGDFIVIKQPEAGKTLIINKSKIVYVEATKPPGQPRF